MTEPSLPAADREERILFKGAKDHVRMIIPEGMDDSSLLADIRMLESRTSELLGGMGVVLDFQGRNVGNEELLDLMRAIWHSGLRILSWVSLDLETQNRLKAVGLHVGEYRAPAPQSGSTADAPLVLLRSLRSGQRVEHEGDVVIVGHVNDGAEILAGGSVVVWGRLKGLAHAGLNQTPGHSITAGAFEAKQVRIGSKVGSYLGMEKEWWGKTVIVLLENDSLIVRELKI